VCFYIKKKKKEKMLLEKPLNVVHWGKKNKKADRLLNISRFLQAEHPRKNQLP